jgi:hypothetical protein
MPHTDLTAPLGYCSSVQSGHSHRDSDADLLVKVSYSGRPVGLVIIIIIVILFMMKDFSC